MAVLYAVTFATFLLENNHFVTLYERLCHFAYYLCTFYGRRSDFYVTVGIRKKHAVELYFVALFYLFAEIVYIQELVLFCFELLSLDLYNYKHFFIMFFYVTPSGGTLSLWRIRLNLYPVRKN